MTDLALLRRWCVGLLLGAIACQGQVPDVNQSQPLPGGAIAQQTQPPTPRLTTQANGQIHVTPLPIDTRFQNDWSDTLEAEFWQRANLAIQHYAGQDYGNTHQENEKRSYPYAMFDFLAGHRERAIAFLQQADSEADDHAHTLGIDYYYAFTLKGQMRKYFFFGSWLDPLYRQRMEDAAQRWTEQDPVERPHPLYGNGDSTGSDWTMRRRGLWVDSRNTDNLRAMRDTSVYLMAEETGNELVRQAYKRKLQRYVATLYHIGMGEWDSSNYHGHTFAAYLNLYDFAADPEVKQLAKAALDWLSAAAAVKYYRGAWAAPIKRDTDTSNVVFGSSAARLFWHYFGDASIPNPAPERDAIHVMTSAYRPPLAVVALARKQFDRPVELLSTKPFYENWKDGNDDHPAFWETTYWGQTYQLGSVVSEFADGDVAPFKLLVNHTERGVDVMAINTGRDRLQVGKRPGDQIGQYRNLLIWLRPTTADEHFFIQLPQTADIEVEQDTWFIQFDQTWVALHWMNLAPNVTGTVADEAWAERYPNETMIQAAMRGQYAGLALEVGEPASHGSYADFKHAVQTRNRLNVEQLHRGHVQLLGTTGDRLELIHNADGDRPHIRRNEAAFIWDDYRDLYRSLGESTPISLGWKEGILSVQAGGHQFETRLSPIAN